MNIDPEEHQDNGEGSSHASILSNLHEDEDLFANDYDPDVHKEETRQLTQKKPRKAPTTSAKNRIPISKPPQISSTGEKDKNHINIMQVLGKQTTNKQALRNESQLDPIDMGKADIPDIDERVEELLNTGGSYNTDVATPVDNANITDILFGDYDAADDPLSTPRGPIEVKEEESESKRLKVTPKLEPFNFTSPITPLSSPIQKISSSAIKVTKAPVITFSEEKNLDLVTPEKEFSVLSTSHCNGEVRFFWIDAREMKGTGEVIFIGKIYSNNKWQSCCFRFESVERTVFALPKKVLDNGQENSLADVARELSELCQVNGIKKRSFKSVDRWYSFEKPDVPTEKSWWVKMKYTGANQIVTTDCQYRTFKSLFGTQQSNLEMVLLKRKIMGPCWLRLTNARKPTNFVSHCQSEFIVPSYKNICVENFHNLPIPPLKVCSLSIVSNYCEKTKANEIYAGSILIVERLEQEKTAKLPELRKSLWNVVRKSTSNSPIPFQISDLFVQKNLPPPELAYNEKALLESLLNKLKSEDPDVLIGHNFLGFHLDVLLHRCQAWHIPNWSILGRLKLREMPKLQPGPGGLGESTHSEKEVVAGRLVCDTYLLSKEYIKASNYSLKSLINQLELGDVGFNNDLSLPRGYFSDASDTDVGSGSCSIEDAYKSKEVLFGLLLSSSEKAIFAAAIALHIDVLPLTKRMTNVTGGVWSRTLMGNRAERIEFLLLHKFHVAKFVIPDKQIFVKPIVKEETLENDEPDDGIDKVQKVVPSRRKPQYAGGMVLDPKRGLYHSFVLLLDFNSLYPSIIQEFNLCFTTLKRHPQSTSSDSAEVEGKLHSPTLSDVQGLTCKSCEASGSTDLSCAHRCILPKTLKELVDGRRQVKKLMQSTSDEEQQNRLNIRQKALKLIANSMYGCLGFQMGRFYAPTIAELVTSEGRNALQNAISLVSKVDPRLDVIYGDTDSVMINTAFAKNLSEVRRIATVIKDTINKCYKTLEIDIDGVFRKLLLLQKKKYASLRIVDYLSEGKQMEREVKGLDIVRREWCPLSKQMCSEIIDMILSTEISPDDTAKNILEYIATAVHKIDDGTVALSEFIITKALNREPEEYANSADHPHVRVAMRMKELNLSVQVGDLIPYVICASTKSVVQSAGKLSAHAYHPHEIPNSDEISVDLLWYKKMQFYPPIMRLLEHIAGCEPVAVAKLFGLEGVRHITQGYCGSKGTSKGKQRADELLDVPEIAFPDAKHLMIRCPNNRCEAMIDVKPHTYLLAKAMESMQRAISGQSSESHDFSWICCKTCSKAIPFVYVYESLLQIHDELKVEAQKSMADSALHHRDVNVGIIFEPIFKQLEYFSSLFSMEKIAKFLQQSLERSVADLQHHHEALAMTYGVNGKNPTEIAQKISHTIIGSVRRFCVGSDDETSAISQREFLKNKEMETGERPRSIDMYDEMQRRIGALQRTVPGYAIPICDIIGSMNMEIQ